jgi:hypothetical protein
VAISACFRGTSTNVSACVGNHPKVGKLTKTIALVALSVLLGVAAGILSHASGLTLMTSISIGAIVGMGSLLTSIVYFKLRNLGIQKNPLEPQSPILSEQVEPQSPILSEQGEENSIMTTFNCKD